MADDFDLDALIEQDYQSQLENFSNIPEPPEPPDEFDGFGPPPPVDPPKSTCAECPSTKLNVTWLEKFGVKVCNKCRYSLPNYDLITKTQAKTDYLLTENDLRDLGHFAKAKNIKNAKWSVIMKLYLESQVRDKMLSKFGSDEGLEKAKANKELKALERKIKIQENKKRRQNRLLADGPPVKKLKIAKHEHQFGETQKDGDLRFRICKDCNYRDEWEAF